MNNPEDCTGPPNAASDTANHEDWKEWLPLPIGIFLGEIIGKLVGAPYSGFGMISGRNIGGWIGIGVGLWLASATVWLVKTKDLRVRRAVAMILLDLVFITPSLVAVFTEAKIGRIGGILGFGSILIIIAVFMYLSKRKSK